VKRRFMQGISASVLMSLLVVGIATAAKPNVIRAGNLVVAINGGVAPKKLPKQRMAPIKLRVATNIRTVDGRQPPVAKRVRIDFDRHGTINARGLPSCRPGQLQARTTKAAKKACPRAIVGSGKASVQVAFAEQAPFSATGPLVAFNGGVRGKTTKMLIHAYVNVPAPTALVTIVKVRKLRKGRFGTRADARIPTVAGGAGALTRFNLAIRRTFKHRGKKRSYLAARCGRGRLFAKGRIFFDDGTRLAGTVTRSCRTRG
jgi:hypothetical protein